MKFKITCKINDLLKEEGRTKTWLAEKIETTPQKVNDWCRGKTNPHIGYILRIIKVTGWKLEDMFKEE